MIYSRFVVGQILSGESRELIVENIHAKLIEVGDKVKQDQIPVELYMITKVSLIESKCQIIWEYSSHSPSSQWLIKMSFG